MLATGRRSVPVPCATGPGTPAAAGKDAAVAWAARGTASTAARAVGSSGRRRMGLLRRATDAPFALGAPIPPGRLTWFLPRRDQAAPDDRREVPAGGRERIEVLAVQRLRSVAQRRRRVGVHVDDDG